MGKRAGREFWTKVIEEFEETSDETHAEFAARHGVEKTTFQRWLYLLRRERAGRPASPAVRMLPVRVGVERGEQAVVVELRGDDREFARFLGRAERGRRSAMNRKKSRNAEAALPAILAYVEEHSEFDDDLFGPAFVLRRIAPGHAQTAALRARLPQVVHDLLALAGAR
jgi:transposase-like protein